MKISTRLRLAIYVPTLIAFVIGGALVFSYQTTSKTQNTGDTVRQIRSSINELNHLIFSYTLFHEERPKLQFLSEHEKLTRLIAGTHLSNPDQQRLLDNIHQNNETIADLFSQLTSAYENGGTQATENRLTGLILSKSYQADSDAALLRRMVDDGIRVNETRTLSLIFLVMIFTSILFTIILVRTRRGITASLSKLSRGAAVIGSGDLDFTIEEKGNDEITDLSRAFNRMSGDLKSVTASKSDLEREIEERKKAEEALKESEQRWAITLASIGDAVIATDVTGRITFMNAIAEELTGWTFPEASERLSTEVFKIINEETRQVVESPVTAVIREGLSVGLANHTILVRKDGKEIPIDDSGAPIKYEDGKMRGVVLVFRDITQRRKADQLKDEFIGMVSHELRTPLTVVTGAIHTAMLAGLPPEELPSLLQEAAHGAASLDTILDNLLELTRHQANRLLLDTKPLYMSEVIDNVVEPLRDKSPLHRLTADIPEQLPSIEADRVRLERVLHNLIDNAIKYSPQGGEVRVFTRQDGDSLIIGVSDQGIGISLEDRTRLFQPFQRLGKPAHGIKGLGLGLVVCLRLVEAHHGRLWVESEPGKGSTFYFTLPGKRVGNS
ncbi:MAG: ATP-binding protein [Dehalococcoidales bacterium]|nr:ATP-binding protein [Dehalococcoidales bacterium]